MKSNQCANAQCKNKKVIMTEGLSKNFLVGTCKSCGTKIVEKIRKEADKPKRSND
jgi:hypothetical protein